VSTISSARVVNRVALAMPVALDVATQAHLRTAVDDLAAEFDGTFSRSTVQRFVDESLEGLGGARFTDFLPVLTYRFARERLRAYGQAEGSIAKDVPEVLFVCVENAGRSQIAAALLAYHARGRVHVRSAGSRPGDRINPTVVEVLAEVGVDVEQAFPKPLTDEVVRAADAVVTMGCGDACPIYPGKRYEDWKVEDPSARSLAEVRTIRDEIDARVRTLLNELVPVD
jgi:arsenate reductase (thioredoxin)